MSIHMKWTLDEFTKPAFAKLLKPFENSIDDVLSITRAFSMATKAHRGQFKKGNIFEPYINHPLRVALILTDEIHIYDLDLICAALLHDILEKDPLANDSLLGNRLRLQFGERVYNIVHALSKPKIKNDDKHRILGEYFHNIAKGSEDVRYIKLADRLDNVRTLKNAPQRNKILRYKEETQKYVVPIAEKTDEKFVFKLSVALYELK